VRKGACRRTEWNRQLHGGVQRKQIIEVARTRARTIRFSCTPPALDVGVVHATCQRDLHVTMHERRAALRQAVPGDDRVGRLPVAGMRRHKPM
jgi:hypothetical protein